MSANKSTGEFKVYIEFMNGDTFEGCICLNPFNNKLVLDNDYGQENVNDKDIKSIVFFRKRRIPPAKIKSKKLSTKRR